MKHEIVKTEPVSNCWQRVAVHGADVLITPSPPAHWIFSSTILFIILLF